MSARTDENVNKSQCMCNYYFTHTYITYIIFSIYTHLCFSLYIFMRLPPNTIRDHSRYEDTQNNHDGYVPWGYKSIKILTRVLQERVEI